MKEHRRRNPPRPVDPIRNLPIPILIAVHDSFFAAFSAFDSISP